jgi:hypothetical protein
MDYWLRGFFPGFSCRVMGLGFKISGLRVMV